MYNSAPFETAPPRSLNAVGPRRQNEDAAAAARGRATPTRRGASRRLVSPSTCYVDREDRVSRSESASPESGDDEDACIVLLRLLGGIIVYWFDTNGFSSLSPLHPLARSLRRNFPSRFSIIDRIPYSLETNLPTRSSVCRTLTWSNLNLIDSRPGENIRGNGTSMPLSFFLQVGVRFYRRMTFRCFIVGRHLRLQGCNWGSNYSLNEVTDIS